MSEPWIDRNEYPFNSNFFHTPAGRMHYVDEGNSDHALIMIHGNPTWSFLYRHLIKGLSDKYRCIAPDHLGFGLSAKPDNWDYLPEGHAENFKLLMERLSIESATLLVHDWGGPIGLSYAAQNPEKVKAIVIMNSWCWPVAGDPHFEQFSGSMSGPMGQFLIKYINFFVRVVMKQAYGDKTKLTKAIQRHYLNALPSPAARKAVCVLPNQIIGASQWLADLWEKRDQFTRKPALALWGKRDIAFRDKELGTWKEAFSRIDVHEFADAGHYVQEEVGPELCPLIHEFVKNNMQTPSE